MITGLNAFMRGRKASAYLVCATALCCVLSACSGSGGGGTGGGTGGGGGGGGNDSGSPATTLSCNGYPQPVQVSVNNTEQTYTQVCLITQQNPQITPSLNVTTVAGNLAGHGQDKLSAFTVYARIIAQAADEATATTLAKSVVVSTANGSVSATPDKVDFPEMLQIDYEVFTAPTTNLTLKSAAGNMSVDNYDATLQLTPTAGNTSLSNVDGKATVNSTKGNISLSNVNGQVTVDTTAGNIGASLSGASWSGAGLSATTQAGNIAVSRPAGYQATITATVDAGVASIDDRSATSTPGPPPAPGIVTVGSGAPIKLESKAGNVSVGTAQ